MEWNVDQIKQVNLFAIIARLTMISLEVTRGWVRVCELMMNEK